MRMNIILSVALLGLCSIVLADDAKPEAKQEGAIHCYQCNEKDDKACGDPFAEKAEFLKPCQNGEKFCRKTVQYGNFFFALLKLEPYFT